MLVVVMETSSDKVTTRQITNGLLYNLKKKKFQQGWDVNHPSHSMWSRHISNIIQQCVWFYASFLNCIMIEQLSNDENGGGWILKMFSYVSSPSYTSINS